MRMGDDGAWDGQPGIDVEVAGLAVKAMVGDAQEHAWNLRRVTQGRRGSAWRAHAVKRLRPGRHRETADGRTTTAQHGLTGPENRSPGSSSALLRSRAPR